MSEAGCLDSFGNLFEQWEIKQSNNLQELKKASRASEQSKEAGENILTEAVEKVMNKYKEYYEAKLRCAEEDPWSVMFPTWSTTVEKAYDWIGGFKPSTAVRLLEKIGDERFDELEMRVKMEEEVVDMKMDEIQNTVVHLPVDCSYNEDLKVLFDKIVLESLILADKLRMDTLKEIIGLLTPKEAVEFLISAAELQLSLREVGLHEDA